MAFFFVLGLAVVMAYSFRPATLDDLPLLREWLRIPDVAAWWGADDPFDAADLTDARLAVWIVSAGGTDFAYMQDYDVHGWPDHHFGHLPAGSRGIDQFIGVPGMLGQGHGTAFIRQRVLALFAAGAPVVATDPHPDNLRAIEAYANVGFRVAGQPQDTRWGHILPMALRAGQPRLTDAVT
ncbi:MAG: acetyltransferase [Rhodobacteraceae bacterium]|nr:acetyltransferase [Paracoccaceae bacterium]